MASGTVREHHLQQPAQQEQPRPSPPRKHDGRPDSGLVDNANATRDAAGDGDGNGTAQSPDPSRRAEPDRPPLFAEDADDGSITSRPSGDGSEQQLASPSASIPPYWSHSHAQQSTLLGPNARHARAVSTSSAESVLPPGAITLQDNEVDDEDDGGRGGRRSNSSEIYGRDRNRACWARSVQVTDYVLVNGSTANIGAFVVWNIRVETLNGSRMNIRKRYSEFDDLRRRLIQTFPNFEAAVPALPPKSVFKRFHPRFLEKRRSGLQYFLNCILLNPEFSGSPVLKEFLFS